MEKQFEKIENALILGDKDKLLNLLLQLEQDELTNYLQNLNPAKTVRLVNILDKQDLANILAQLSPQTSAELLSNMTRAQAADVLEELEPDEAADVIGEIPEPRKDLVLLEMRQPERTEVSDLLEYPEDTAGAIMTPRYVAVTADATVDEALAVVRSLARKLESIYYLYILDHKDRLVGVLSLRRLILADPGTKVSTIMRKKPVSARIDEDQEDAAQKILEHDLTAVPVVDKQKKLVGIITYDDAARILEEEASEDIEKIGGAAPLDRPYLETPLLSLARKRVGWLFILFIAQTLTGNVLSFFQGTLSQVVALSFFIPLLIGTGGNIGSQTVTLVVRALAVGQVDLDDLARIIWKEARTGILLGIILGAVGFFWARIFTGDPLIGVTVGLSILTISLFAAAVGALIPLVLTRLNLDPATASTPFISTVVDASGLLIYFLIARTLLNL